jgi:hypothetical protein
MDRIFQSKELVIGSIVVLAVSVGFIFFLWRVLGRKVAETPAYAGRPFEMRCAPDDDRRYRVYLRYDVLYPLTVEFDFGLVIRVQGFVDGQRVLDTMKGVGDKIPADVEKIRWGSNSNSTYTPGKSNCEETVVLGDLGPRRRGSEIIVRGTIEPSPETEVVKLRLWVAR